MTLSLLDELVAGLQEDFRPWGVMNVLSAPRHDLTVKVLRVHDGHRTSLQYHERKDELLLIISGNGFVEVDEETFSTAGDLIRIEPGARHRVTGPLLYLEISTYDAGDDTIRLEDDYSRP